MWSECGQRNREGMDQRGSSGGLYYYKWNLLNWSEGPLVERHKKFKLNIGEESVRLKYKVEIFQNQESMGSLIWEIQGKPIEIPM